MLLETQIDLILDFPFRTAGKQSAAVTINNADWCRMQIVGLLSKLTSSQFASDTLAAHQVRANVPSEDPMLSTSETLRYDFTTIVYLKRTHKLSKDGRS